MYKVMQSYNMYVIGIYRLKYCIICMNIFNYI